MLDESLQVLTKAAMLVFVVASMGGIGLSLTVRQILGPLRDLRLVSQVLAVNFVLVPVLAVLVVAVVPMDVDARTTVLVLGCAAGAPFIPTLSKQAGGEQTLAVGLTVVLMVVTVGYLPLVLPVVTDGLTVSAGDIATSLVLFMLVPLAIGLAVHARYPDLAAHLAPRASHASTTGLLLGVGAGLLVAWRQIVGSVGSGVLVALLVLVAASLALGAAAGWGGTGTTRRTTALATAQRNISAALVVAAQVGGDVVVLTTVAALALPVVLLLVAGELGRRATATAAPTPPVG